MLLGFISRRKFIRLDRHAVKYVGARTENNALAHPIGYQSLII